MKEKPTKKIKVKREKKRTERRTERRTKRKPPKRKKKVSALLLNEITKKTILNKNVPPL